MYNNIKQIMFRHYLKHFEILLKSVKSAHYNGIFLQYFINY